MGKILAIITLFFSCSLMAQDLSTIRKQYREATESEQGAEKLQELLKNVTENNRPEFLAYKGASIVLLARFKPITQRMRPIKEGINLIEGAINKSKDNVEIRWIRLTIQENTPKIVGYKKNIEEDMKFIKANLSKSKDPELKNMINGYFQMEK